MMVLPVGGFPGQKPKKNGKKGKGPPDSSVQVNLIVDPTMFGRDPEGAHDEEDEEDELKDDEDEEYEPVSALASMLINRGLT